MAASDNVATAAAALRRLASKAVGRTATPSPSDDEGGSGPAGASNQRRAFRLDPADNVTNQVTAPEGANVNKLDAISVTGSMVGAAGSPTASQGTQEPIWPPAMGSMTSLESYLAATHMVDTARLISGTDIGCAALAAAAGAGEGDPTSSTPPTARPSTL